jgi:hypothetical protein
MGIVAHETNIQAYYTTEIASGELDFSYVWVE